MRSLKLGYALYAQPNILVAAGRKPQNVDIIVAMGANP